MSPASLPLKNPRRPPRSYVLRMISITVPCDILQTARHGTWAPHMQKHYFMNQR